MTSMRSPGKVLLRSFGVPLVILSFMIASDETLFEVVLAAVFFAAIGWADFCKRSTLRQRDDGVYVWIEWHGSERTSIMDPSAPGGEWECDGDGGDGGD